MRIPTLSFIAVLTACITGCNAPETATAAPKVTQVLPQDHHAIGQATGQGVLPRDHPSVDAPASDRLAAHAQGGGGTAPPVVVPEGVRGRWSAVHLAVTDSAGNRSELRAPLGSTAELPGGLALRADPYMPSYMSDNSGITSRSNEPDNPAVLVALLEGGKVVDEGWVFRDWPDFNTFTGSRVRVELLRADPAAVPAKAPVDTGGGS